MENIKKEEIPEILIKGGQSLCLCLTDNKKQNFELMPLKNMDIIAKEEQHFTWIHKTRHTPW